MNTLKNLMFCGICALGTAALLTVSSCTDPDSQKEDPAVSGTSITLGYEAGSEVTANLTFNATWEVNHSVSWLTVLPLRGEAGEQTLTFRTSEANTSVQERISTFLILDGGLPTQYHVIQRGTPGMVFSGPHTVSGEEQTFSVNFTTNVSDIQASTEADWLTVGEITYGEYPVLTDNITTSNCRTATISLSATHNEGGERQATVTLVSGDVTATLTVVQTQDLGVNFGRSFYRRSMIMKFTSTGCTYCPAMTTAIENAMSAMPGRIVPISIFREMNGMDDFYYQYGTQYASIFRITGLPDAYINFYGKIGYRTAQAVMAGAQEAIDELPAKTGIAGVAKIEGDKIRFNLSVAAKEAGTYYVNIFILEDGIMKYQVSGGADYIHNHIAMDQMTGIYGETATIEQNTVYTREFTHDIPSGIVDRDNMYLAVYVTYEGTFNGSSNQLVYNNYGYVVDNAAIIPCNGNATVFEYEN